MALSKDILKAQATLAALTDAQLDAIIELSANDENEVIGARIGQLHGQYDQDILGITGIAKGQGEKSYEYAKRVIKQYKDKAEAAATIEAELATLKTEKADLETKLKTSAGDAHLKQQLADTEKKLTDLQALFDVEKANLSTEKANMEKELFDYKLNNELDKALSQMKFKASLPETVKQILIDNAKQKLSTEYKPEFTTVNNKPVLVFRDAEGNIMTNKANALNPFTATELLTSHLKDAIDTTEAKPGVGTKPTTAAGNTGGIDLSSARSQVEADEAIEQHLLQSGYTRTSEEFATELTKIRTENAVDKLPLR